MKSVPVTRLVEVVIGMAPLVVAFIATKLDRRARANSSRRPSGLSGVVGNYRHHSARSGTAPSQAQREAGDREPVRGQGGEVDQALDLRVGEVGLVRRP